MNAINWFEIPATDLERAYDFYYSILSGKVKKGTFGNGELVLFDVPFNSGEAVGGSIVVRENFVPTAGGAMIYLNAFGPLSEATNKVESSGGQVLVPFMDLGKFGFASIIIDSEGNRIGLLSNER
ncbi:MAG: VOC family protein [Saprospiraceae bacterium]|nr:VOC family protein [Saprospiraceae bacterium]